MTRGRLRSVLLPVASACVVALALTGCGPSTEPDPPRTPDPIPTPLYSSDEEALAAAKDAYAKYIAVSNQVGHDGWTDLSPLKTVATGKVLKADLASGASGRSRGWRSVGDAVGAVDSIQQVNESEVVAYACLDVSATQVVDGNGVEQAGTDRAPVLPFEVGFVERGAHLLVERTSRWSDLSFCS